MTIWKASGEEISIQTIRAIPQDWYYLIDEHATQHDLTTIDPNDHYTFVFTYNLNNIALIAKHLDTLVLPGGVCSSEDILYKMIVNKTPRTTLKILRQLAQLLRHSRNNPENYSPLILAIFDKITLEDIPTHDQNEKDKTLIELSHLVLEQLDEDRKKLLQAVLDRRLSSTAISLPAKITALNLLMRLKNKPFKHIDSSDIDLLEAALQSNRSNDRYIAAKALGEMASLIPQDKRPTIVDALIRRLSFRESMTEVQHAATIALGNIASTVPED